jgi:hypothetical protein
LAVYGLTVFNGVVGRIVIHCWVQVAEELLLADRAALAAEDPDTMRVVAAKRRLVELSILCATKVRLACMEGVDFARKMFVTTQPRD